MVTKEQIGAGFKVVHAVAEAVREAREIPAGTVYAACMGTLNLNEFERVIGILTRSELVERRGDLLCWVGPELE